MSSLERAESLEEETFEVDQNGIISESNRYEEFKTLHVDVNASDDEEETKPAAAAALDSQPGSPSHSPHRPWNRARGSPKREKLIQSLRGARSPRSRTAKASTTKSHDVSSNVTDEGPERSPVPTAAAAAAATTESHSDSRLALKSSMPTDEDTENDAAVSIQHNETNEQEYLSAEEDTFSSSTDGQSSEWDVAVRKGKATIIGRQAAKDFFANLPPVFSGVTTFEQHEALANPSLTTEDEVDVRNPTTPSKSTSDDDEEDVFSTPMMMHYGASHSTGTMRQSQDDNTELDHDGDTDSNFDFIPSGSYSTSKDDGYGGYTDEEEEADDEENDEYDDAETTNDETPQNTIMQRRPKRNVLVHVQSNKSNEMESAAIERKDSESNPVRHYNEEELSAGMLPEVFINMRLKIEAMSMFDSDIIKLTANSPSEVREALKRSSQQSISAATLATLAHKRYERRRLASMEIEKLVRSLVMAHRQQQKKQPNGSSKNDLERVRSIMLLLSEDYVRSTNEDARKGGVVALAACAFGLKMADDKNPIVMECRDIILASVVYACQDHASRVRYYSAESLMNVVKIIPGLAVEHFFILYEVLRSLYADANPAVRGGAVQLDKALKGIIVGAMNSGAFTAEACVPVFARFVHVKNKATKQLTLTWLQELNEKLIGSPILEFLHIFLGGVIDMVADPSIAIRSSALAFLQSVLPKLLDVDSSGAIDDFEEQGAKVDFDKILQSLVTTMEHANPSVRKVAVYWMFKIVKAHMDGREPSSTKSESKVTNERPSAASVSVRNSVPHVLPGILLSIGDTSTGAATTSAAKDAFLPDQSTQSLAEQTNTCLQEAVRRDGRVFVEYLDGFIVALREELATPGGLSSKNPPAIERSSYRGDIPQDGTGIERPGWFRASKDSEAKNMSAVVSSRLCALQWVTILYEHVVPDQLKADYAREFVMAIIRQLADKAPEIIVNKSLEVLAKITVAVPGEDVPRHAASNPLAGLTSKSRQSNQSDTQEFPMTESSVSYALNILGDRRRLRSRDNEVFSSLIQLHCKHEELMADLSRVITNMCKLQPPEFVMVSFAVELDKFVLRCKSKKYVSGDKGSMARDLRFVSSFVQHLNHVLLNAPEAEDLRLILKDCIAFRDNTERHHQRSRLFFILLHSFSHNIAATISLCLWAGSYRTACLVLGQINPLEITLVVLLELDCLIELLERPLFRHLHVRMLESDNNALDEGSGSILFQLLKAMLMIIPQSTSYCVLRDRLSSVARLRQSAIKPPRKKPIAQDTKSFVARVTTTRKLHCECAWKTIRQESLEEMSRKDEVDADEKEEIIENGRRSWLGFASRKEQAIAKRRRQATKDKIERGVGQLPGNQKYESLAEACEEESPATHEVGPKPGLEVQTDHQQAESDNDVSKLAQDAVKEWKQFWVDSSPTASTDNKHKTEA